MVLVCCSNSAAQALLLRAKKPWHIQTPMGSLSCVGLECGLLTRWWVLLIQKDSILGQEAAGRQIPFLGFNNCARQNLEANLSLIVHTKLLHPLCYSLNNTSLPPNAVFLAYFFSVTKKTHCDTLKIKLYRKIIIAIYLSTAISAVKFNSTGNLQCLVCDNITSSVSTITLVRNTIRTKWNGRKIRSKQQY